MSTERAWFTINEINEWSDRYLARQKEKTMTEEDEEFNRIEREAAMRRAAVHATVTKKPWVGSTPVERARIYVRPTHEWMQAMEELLKEKNT